jgi:LmbE family N-acetylglucosaminyl deacetylase
MSQLKDFTLGLPDIDRAMVLAPHPDDESLGCGGTIALYSNNVHFTVVALSHGEAVNIPEDNRGELRRKECEDAIRILGAHALVCLDLPDGKFSEHGDSIRSQLSGLFADHKPQIVFVPAPVDIHPDHRETALSCIEASRGFPGLRLAFYEIYNPVRFNVLVDIGPVIEKKKQALMRYHYSMLKKEETFVASNLGLNRSRSLFTLRDSYYEAFWMPAAPPTLADVIKWFSNDLQMPSPEDRLLDNLRAADSLVHEMRLCEEKVREKEKTAEELTIDLRQKEETIAVLRDHVRLLETGLFQRLAKKCYGVRDTFFPKGTSRKRFYERVIGKIKDRLPHKKN